MAFYNFSQEEFKQILDFVNDENKDVLKNDTTKRFINLYAAFSDKLLKAYDSERSRAMRLEKSNIRLQSKLNTKRGVGNYKVLEWSTLDLALCMLYCQTEIEGYYDRNRMQYMLFEAYSRWLVEYDERITDEHPVAQEWGPHFWSISSRFKKSAPAATRADFDKIAEKNPGLAAFLRNVVRKYNTWSDNDLKDMCIESIPYQRAKKNAKSSNPDEQKWGRKINDADIFEWKQ